MLISPLFKKIRTPLGVLIFLVILLIILVSWSRYETELSFNKDIRPIFNSHCVSCHGGVKQNGGLNLIFRESALSELESGKKAIVPGRPSQSELIARITSDDDDHRMPLDAKPLTQQQIKTLSRWIRQGARWEKHWAYIIPKSPVVPDVKSGWARSEIDRFIEAKLNELNLKPNTDAPKETLIRRASMDLLGLPPTLQEMDEFLNDAEPGAYERLLDRLLDSPRFGERWASMWLDLARYADSKGYEKDNHREIWKYRDWVIQAFNDDKPFDQFTIEQIAGDLLPQPSNDQYVATGFHRNTMNNSEGGVQNEEFRIAAVMDRVNTTWEVWNSTSFACAQCHGHPYDPFTHEEYYQYLAFFNNSRDEDIGDDSPNLKFFNEVDKEEIKEIKDWIKTRFTNPDPQLLSNEIDHLLHITEPKVRSYKAEVISRTAKVGDDYILQAQDQGTAVFRNFPFYGVTKYLTQFRSLARDGSIELRIDSISGRQIGKWVLGEPGWKYQIFELVEVDGVHDLFMTFNSPLARTKENQGVCELFWILPNQALSVFEGEENHDVKSEFMKLLQAKRPRTPIMVENSNAFHRKTRVFQRGSWMSPTETVDPGIPSIMPSTEENVESTRLGLAQWLTSPNNPLTARVLANRLWEQLFGRGLVLTLEDFGSQGEPPSHSRLLDYMAISLQSQHSWSIKGFLKEIMLSSTYRQSSGSSEAKQFADPYNTYLSRGPRFRLSAEQIRDQALAVSGLLSDKMYGPSVMPHLPEGAWNVVYPQYNNVHWKLSDGSDKYRRALYTYWKRTSPYPAMVTFDVQNRDLCSSRRIRTNTPLQALLTLNDPVFIEAANHLGEWMMKQSDEVDTQIDLGYQKALCEKPDQITRDALVELYHQAREGLDQEDSHYVVDYNEIKITSAAAVVANAIMNLDAFMMKE